MNRDIKFRVFDKKSNEMHDDLRLYEIVEDDLWYDGETDMWGVFYDACNEQEQFAVMQYTGIKDKNGKEIYEGDIITFYNKIGKEVCLIYYDKELLSLNMKQYPKGYIYDGLYNLRYREEVEVIGNIYESEVENENSKKNI